MSLLPPWCLHGNLSAPPPPKGVQFVVESDGPSGFHVLAMVEGLRTGRVQVERQRTVTIEFFDPVHKWQDVRGSEWAVVHAQVDRPRHGIGTRMYELAAEEVRRRGGAFLSSDTIRSESSQNFWSTLERRFRHKVRFLGDRYCMNLRAMPAKIDLRSEATS